MGQGRAGPQGANGFEHGGHAGRVVAGPGRVGLRVVVRQYQYGLAARLPAGQASHDVLHPAGAHVAAIGRDAHGLRNGRGEAQRPQAAQQVVAYPGLGRRAERMGLASHLRHVGRGPLGRKLAGWGIGGRGARWAQQPQTE